MLRLRDLGCLAVVALSPFESDAVALPVPGLGLRLTALEAAIALAVTGAVANAAQTSRRGPQMRPGALVLSTLGLAAAAFVSALAAPAEARAAWLGAMRLLGVGLLTFAFAEAVRDAAQRRLVRGSHPGSPLERALAWATAALLALGALEQMGGDGMLGPRGAALDETLLALFRPKASVTEVGARRLTASFGHANLAACWLVMATPLLLGAAIAWRRWRQALGLLALGVVGLAATLSRAGLVAGLAAIGLLLLFLTFAEQRRTVDFVRGRPKWLTTAVATTALVALAFVLVASPSFEDRWGLRSRPPIAVEYRLTTERTHDGGSRVVLDATNRGSLCWRPWGRDRHELELRLPRGVDPGPEAGPTADDAANALRRPLAHRVCTGETTTAIWTVAAPLERLAGARAEVVHNGLHGFAALGVAAATIGPTAEAEFPPPVAGLTPAGRPALWQAALALWQQRPLLGHGADNFRLRKATVMDTPGLDDREHANNVLLEVLADLGLLGALALLALVWYVAVAAWAAWRRADVTAFAAVAACLGFAVHGLADSPLFSWGPMVLLALALGTLQARTASSTEHGRSA